MNIIMDPSDINKSLNETEINGAVLQQIIIKSVAVSPDFNSSYLSINSYLYSLRWFLPTLNTPDSGPPAQGVQTGRLF